MTILFWLINLSAVLSLGALVMTIWNLRLYRLPLRDNVSASPPSISVCIPARNEQRNLEACVRSLLDASTENAEILVYDDHSTDDTPTILERLCREDHRIRRVATKPLPPGWNGKQFGCDQMGRVATGDWLLFTDADVRFSPDALRSATSVAEQRQADLISTFPRQITGSIGEKLMLPMIMFILLSYLPMIRMRRTLDPAASAGCGQFLFVRRSAWHHAGGHAEFKSSMHDGIMLPRLLRQHGYRTDLFDGTQIASVRMYEGWLATWRGFAKNAYEGLGSPSLLIFLTVVHLLGHVLPWCVLVGALVIGFWSTGLIGLSVAACFLHLVQRYLIARRFEHNVSLTLAHPISISLMVLVQWYSAILHWSGRRSWRGRVLQADTGKSGSVICDDL